MKQIQVNELSNVFEKISKEWMLVSAKKTDGSMNTMTASWGGLGFLWGKNVAFVFVRPQRFTKEFIDEQDYLSLSFFSEDYRKMLSFMGSKSGRNIDKIKEQNLTVLEDVAPVFEEAKLTLICKKLYAQEMEKDCFLDNEIIEKWFPNNDYHTMYVVDILKVLEN